MCVSNINPLFSIFSPSQKMRLVHLLLRDMYNNWMFDNRMTRHMKKLFSPTTLEDKDLSYIMKYNLFHLKKRPKIQTKRKHKIHPS